ncbi:MAG: 50S ribosomal protein L1 [Gammaproteobacteria bacterium]|nr:MAG: 50S ribosomal protein L1 [Gammaproteobacteria bacterium]
MARLSKRVKAWEGKFEANRDYAPLDAFAIVKELATAKFDESVDISVNLGVDPRKSDQVVRGSVVLPHGTGKTVRVAVFADGEQADAAKEAGADIVGMDDLADEVKKGNIDFDVVIASPDSMRVVGQLGQILGPRGLMPNPKVGTVTTDVAGAVRNAKAGQVQFRTDKAGLIHGTIGRASFTPEALLENMKVFIAQLNRLKPSSSKGIYMKKITVSSTMGPGLSIERSAVAE